MSPWGTPWSRIHRPVRRCQKNELSDSRLSPTRHPPTPKTRANRPAMDGRTVLSLVFTTGRRLNTVRDHHLRQRHRHRRRPRGGDRRTRRRARSGDRAGGRHDGRLRRRRRGGGPLRRGAHGRPAVGRLRLRRPRGGRVRGPRRCGGIPTNQPLPVPRLPAGRRDRPRRGGHPGGAGTGRGGRRDAAGGRRRPPRRPARAGGRRPGPPGAVPRRGDRRRPRTARLAGRGPRSTALRGRLGLPLPRRLARGVRRRPAHRSRWRPPGGAVNQFCPRCGALFAPDVNMEFSTTAVLCVECGLALEEPPQVLAPSETDGAQVAYDLIEWPPEDRVIATDDLVELGIPYRWEEGVVLVVPTSAEAQVDALLDEIDENAADGEGEGEAALLEVEAGEDGGEEAAAAMGDLF